MKNATVEKVSIANDASYSLIPGPCQLENLHHALMLAEKIAAAAEEASIFFNVRTSYDETNRISVSGKRGLLWI